MPRRTRDHQSWLIEKLTDPARAAAYLNAAIEDSREMFLEALRDVAQARQMSRVARDAGVTRESLYRATSEIGNPTLDTLDSVLAAIGIKIKFEAEESISSSSVIPPNQNRAGIGSIPIRPKSDPGYSTSGIAAAMLPSPPQTAYVARWTGVAAFSFQQSGIGKEKDKNLTLIPMGNVAGCSAGYKLDFNAEETEKPPFMQVPTEPQNIMQLQP